MSSFTTQRAFSVFTALRTSSRIVSDDTQVEKFITWIESTVQSKGDAQQFLSNIEVDAFLKFAAEQKSDEPYQVLIIALRVGPFLLQVLQNTDGSPSDTGFPSWVCVFDYAQDEGSWAEASVRNAWVLGIGKTCTYRNGLKWCLNSGLLNTLVRLLQDESMFVAKEAQKVILDILPSLELLCKEGIGDNIHLSALNTKFNIELKKVLQAPLSNTFDHRNFRSLENSLGLLQGLCKYADAGVELKDLVLDDDLILTLLSQLECQRISSQPVVVYEIVMTIDTVLTCRLKGGGGISLVSKKIVELPAKLLSLQKVYPALVLANCLFRRLSDVDHAILQEIMTFPLLILAGRPLSSLTNTHLNSIAEALDSKSAKVSTVLHSLRIINATDKLDTTLLSQDLVALFHMSCGFQDKHMLATEFDSMNLRQNMIKTLFNHSRIQLCILDVISTWIKEGIFRENASYISIIQACLHLLEKHGIPAQLSNKISECIFLCIVDLTSRSEPLDVLSDMNKSLDILGERIKMGLCDICWEVRDSAVEMVGKFIKGFSDDNVICPWLLSQSMIEQVWKSLEDGQSYVRASALTALSYLPARPTLWKGLSTQCSEEDILQKISGIIKTDTEAFSRRAAVQLLCDWSRYSMLAHVKSDILQTINYAITDLDWEVKSIVLNYWSATIDKNDDLPDYASVINSSLHSETESDKFNRKLKEMHHSGGLKSLLYGLTDYDQCVQCKACEILTKLKRLSIRYETVDGEPPVKKCRLGDRPEKVLTLDDLFQCADKSFDWKNGLSCDMFINILISLDLETILLQLSESTDFYVRNPETLIDDILTSLANEEDGDDNAIDCY